MARSTARSRTLLIVLILPLACLFVAGCMLRLVYPRLDTIAAWKFDRELRLERDQERWLSARLEERLSWHRAAELPRWRDWLQDVRDDVAARRLTADGHAQHSARLLSLLKDSGAGFVDVLVELAASLDDRQIEHFLGRYDEESADIEEELAEKSADERMARRRERALDRAEDWLGSLALAQKNWVAEWSRDSIDWLAYAPESRRRWRAFLVETLAARGDAEKLRAGVERMLRRPESLRSPDYQRAVDRYEAHLRTLHVHLLATLTEAQRRHLLGEIDDWLDDLVALCAARG